MPMKNNKYWRDREREHIKKKIKDDERIARRLSEKYREARDDIKKEIEAFYGRYARAEGITMDEARQRVSKADIEDYKRKAKKYVKEKNFTPRANEEMRLYNVTMRVNRLELLKREMQLELLGLTSDEERRLYAELTKNVAAEFERQSSILGMTLNANAETIAAIVDSSFMGAKWSDRVWANQEALKAELDKLITRGIVQGKNPRELARELNKTFDTGMYNAERIMRTEMARAQTDAFINSAEQAGIDYYEWIAEPSACDDCAALDGKVFKIDDMEIGRDGTPLHPNCRCSLAMNVEKMREEWEEDLEGRGLLESEGKGIEFSDSVIGDMTEEQYKILENILNEAPEDVRKVWSKVQNNLVTVSSKSKQSFYRHNEGVRFSYAADSSNESLLTSKGKPRRGMSNFETFFHEHGHHIDALYGKDGTIKKRYKSIVTKKMVSQDMKVRKYKSEELGISSSLKKEINEAVKKFDANDIEDLAVKLKKYADENYPKGYGGVSDIISGITNDRVNMGWRHDKKYWRDMKDLDGLGREAFAHMFAAHTMQGDANKFINEVFPKSYKIFKDFIKEASK